MLSTNLKFDDIVQETIAGESHSRVRWMNRVRSGKWPPKSIINVSIDQYHRNVTLERELPPELK